MPNPMPDPAPSGLSQTNGVQLGDYASVMRQFINENVTEREPKGGVGKLSQTLPPEGARRRRGSRISVRQLIGLEKRFPLTAASSPPIEPLERGCFVSKTLNVDAVLAPYQFDVLMGDAQLLGVSQQRDLM